MGEGTAPERIEWVDAAKGIAILLVVLYHAALLGLQAGLALEIWADINLKLAAFRMPLFFFAAGLFAGSAIRRTWSALWTRRLAQLVWAFLLWSVIRFGYFVAVPMEARPHETDLTRLLIGPLWPSSGLWFLQALLVFLVVAKLLARVPSWVILSTAFVLSSAFFSFATTGNLSYTSMLRYFLFFLIGLRFREWILRTGSRAHPLLAVGGLVLFGATIVFVDAAEIRGVPGVMPVVGLLACAVGSVVARASVATPLRRPLTYLGRKTLPIYVTHVILVAASLHVISALFAPLAPVSALLVPPVVAAVAVTGALVIAFAVRGVPVLECLYAVPRWFAGVRPPAAAAR